MTGTLPGLLAVSKKWLTIKIWLLNVLWIKKGFVNNSSNLERFSSPQNKLNSLTETSKQERFSKTAKKLSNPSISCEDLTGLFWKDF